MNGEYEIVLDKEGVIMEETEMNGAAKILNPPVVGKFPNLQDQLRTHLQNCYLRCDHAVRQIQQAATERAEMYEHMVQETKEALDRDKALFNSMEG
jgi:hypothetical protein